MKKSKEQAPNGVSKADKAAGWLAGKLHWLQLKWAGSMDRHINGLSPAKRKVVIASALLLMFGYNILVTCQTFGSDGHHRYRPADIRLPASVHRDMTMIDPQKLPKEVRRVLRYRQYLDSLSKTRDGSRTLDSLLHGYPGLLDSMDRIKNIYCRK